MVDICISSLGVLGLQKPFLLLDVAFGVTMVIALRELRILAGKGLNDVILVEVYYWL